MVKIRVSGNAEEVDKVVERLRSWDDYVALSVSKAYPNRDGGGVRVYVDMRRN